MNYDILGNIALLKFKKGVKVAEKKKLAKFVLEKNKSVRTVLEKSDKFKGRLRTLSSKYLLGEKTKEVLYKENGCLFRFNVDSCYFSPRLSSERKEISSFVKKNEDVLVMFSGVAPFPIVIAKNTKAKKVISVELSRECKKYAEINIKLNKLNDRVLHYQGDVRRLIGDGKKISEKFDRIVMARPNLKDDFLDVAFNNIKRKGIIHYYGFYSEEEVESKENNLKSLIISEAKKFGKKIKLLRIVRAGDIGVRKWRYRADIKVLN